MTSPPVGAKTVLALSLHDGQEFLGPLKMLMRRGLVVVHAQLFG